MSAVTWDNQLPGIPLEIPRVVDALEPPRTAPSAPKTRGDDAQFRVEAILRAGSAELLQSVRETMQELGTSLRHDVRRELQHLIASRNGSKDSADSSLLRDACCTSPRASIHTLQTQEPFVTCAANTRLSLQSDFGSIEDLTPDLIKSTTISPGKLEYGLDPVENGDSMGKHRDNVEAGPLNHVGRINHEVKSWAWSCDSHQALDGVLHNGNTPNQNGAAETQEVDDDPTDSRTNLTNISDGSSSTRSFQHKKSLVSARSARSYGNRVSTTISDKIAIGFEEVGAFGMFVQYLVRHPGFDYVMGFILLGNAAWVGVQVDFMAREKRDKNDPPTVFRVVDVVFCILFVIELTLRILCYRSKFLRVKGWQWNLFDIVVVTFQLADEITKVAVSGSEAQEVFDNMGVLRLMRLGRIVRLIRMVRLIPELKSMVYLISASMASFFWTMTLLMILIYCVAIFFTENAMDIALNASQDEVGSIYVYWGSIPRAAQSLFQAITGGDDWENFLKPLRAESSFVNVFVFSLYIAFASLVMLNLVTGVFVEGAQRIIRKDKDQEMMKQVTKLFFDTDENNDMKISEKEFLFHLESSKMDEYFKNLELNRQQARAVFTLLDTDEDKTLDIQEFVKGCFRLRGPARSVDLSTFIVDFRQFKRHHIHLQGKVDKHLNQLAAEIRKLTKQQPAAKLTSGGRPPSIA